MKIQIEKSFYGVGVNNADYQITKSELIDGKWKVVWVCPFYRKWADMLARCYSKKLKKRHISYVECVTVPEWHYFMTFRDWMVQQDWEGKQLDKDLLFPGNKVYGPDTCVFISPKLNSFLTERNNLRGKWPIGVSFHKATGKFTANCQEAMSDKQLYLGLFIDPTDAHKAWLNEKLNQAKILASQETDERVAKALINRYENYVYKSC